MKTPIAVAAVVLSVFLFFSGCTRGGHISDSPQSVYKEFQLAMSQKNYVLASTLCSRQLQEDWAKRILSTMYTMSFINRNAKMDDLNLLLKQYGIPLSDITFGEIQQRVLKLKQLDRFLADLLVLQDKMHEKGSIASAGNDDLGNELSDVRINGDTAVGKVAHAGREPRTATFRKVEGRWYLDISGNL